MIVILFRSRLTAAAGADYAAMDAERAYNLAVNHFRALRSCAALIAGERE